MMQQGIQQTSSWGVNRVFALIIGIFFLVLAVFGWIFAPTSGMLFAVFHTGTTRNIVDSATAILALLAVAGGNTPSRWFNQVFGIIYLAIGILGLIPAFNAGGTLFDFIHVNPVENIMDIVLGAIGVYIGFFVRGVGNAPTL